MLKAYDEGLGTQEEVKARTLDALIEAIRQALASVTAADVEGWFGHCGHVTTRT